MCPLMILSNNIRVWVLDFIWDNIWGGLIGELSTNRSIHKWRFDCIYCETLLVICFILLIMSCFLFLGLFIPGFPKLIRFQEHHDRILKKLSPRLFKHLVSYVFSPYLLPMNTELHIYHYLSHLEYIRYILGIAY